MLKWSCYQKGPKDKKKCFSAELSVKLSPSARKKNTEIHKSNRMNNLMGEISVLIPFIVFAYVIKSIETKKKTTNHALICVISFRKVGNFHLLL